MPQRAQTLISYFESSRFARMDPAAQKVQDAVHTVFRSMPGGMRVKSWLNGAPIRHRMHPMFVDVPVGAWTTSLYLDILAAMAGEKQRSRMEAGADAAIALGVAGALPAAMSGLADWVDTSGSIRRAGSVHALLNTVALSLYSGSLVARRAGVGSRGVGLALSSLGYAVVSLSAAIGGDLVYSQGVNVPYRPGPHPPEEFIDVMAASDLKAGEPAVVQAGDMPVMLVRRESGSINALQHWCPHMGGPLSEGKFEDGVVQCPWHLSRFRLDDGAPVQGPASEPLQVLAIREEGDRILVGPPVDSGS